MHIRESLPTDIGAITQLTRLAFDESEAEDVAQLCIDLIQSPEPTLSIVATLGDDIIGHVIFSPIYLEQHRSTPAYILAPLAVAPSHQKQGVGTRLVEFGLEALKAQSVQAVFVLGDPNYYGRLGFYSSDDLSSPYAIDYPEAWQVMALKDGALDGCKGKTACTPVLMNPHYW